MLLFHLLRDGDVVLLVDGIGHVNHAVIHAWEETFEVLDNFLERWEHAMS